LIKYIQKNICELKNNQFYSKISLAFIVQVVVLILGFVSNIILAKVLGASGYGLFALSLNWLLMFSLFSRLGFDTSITKFIPIYYSSNDWSSIKGLVKASSLVIFLSSIIIYGIVAFVILCFLDLPKYKEIYFLTFFCALPFYSLIKINSSIFRAFKMVISSLSSSIILSITFAIILGSLYLIAGNSPTLSTISGLYIALSCIVLVLFSCKLSSNFKTFTGKLEPVYHYRSWFLVSIPLLLIESMQFFLGQTDILMLGVLSTERSVGYYQAAIKISSITTFGLSAVNFILAPEISRLYNSKKLKELQEKVTQSSKLLLILGFSASFFLILFGSFILSMFGEDFKIAYFSTVILIVGQFVNVLTGAVGFLMSLTGYHNIALKVIVISVLINVILNYFLIPIYDIKGASIATAITTIIRNVWMAVLVKKILKIKPTIIY